MSSTITITITIHITIIIAITTVRPLAEDRVRRSPDPEIPKIRMNLLRSPGFHPWTQDRQGTLKSMKTYIQFGKAPARPTFQDRQGTMHAWGKPWSDSYSATALPKPPGTQDRQGALNCSKWDLACMLAKQRANVKIAKVP